MKSLQQSSQKTFHHNIDISNHSAEKQSKVSSQEGRETFTKIIFNDEKCSIKHGKEKYNQNQTTCDNKRSCESYKSAFSDFLKVSPIACDERHFRKTYKNSIFINQKLNQNVQTHKEILLRPKSAFCSVISVKESGNQMVPRRTLHFFNKKNHTQTQLSLKGSQVVNNLTSTPKMSSHYLSSNVFTQNTKSACNLSSFMGSKKVSLRQGDHKKSALGNFESIVVLEDKMCEKQLAYSSKDILKKLSFNYNGKDNGILYKKTSSYQSASQVFYKKTANGRPKSAVSGKHSFSSLNSYKDEEKKVVEARKQIFRNRRSQNRPDHEVKGRNSNLQKQAKLKRKRTPNFSRPANTAKRSVQDPQILIEHIQFTPGKGKRQYYNQPSNKQSSGMVLEQAKENQFVRSIYQGKIGNQNAQTVLKKETSIGDKVDQNN